MFEDIDFSEPAKAAGTERPEIRALLAEAEAAGVALSLVRGRLAIDLRSVRWDRWPRVKASIDHVGEDAICRFLEGRA
jgi:hypothetical protein